MAIKKTPNASPSNTAKLTFVSRVLAGLNKTEAEKTQEKVERFVEDTIRSLEQQVSNREFEIRKQTSNLKFAEKDLDRAKKFVENTIYTISDDTESYLSAFNDARKQVEVVENNIANIKNNIATLEAEIKEFNFLLERLKA